MMNIVLFGAGGDAKNFFSIKQKYPKLYNDNIITILDNDNNKWGTLLNDYTIKNPINITNLEFDKVIISSSKYKTEIRESLKKLHNVSDDVIMDMNDYKYQKIIEYQYKQNLEKNKLNEDKINFKKFNEKSLVIYTAIIGDYDDLKEPQYIDNAHYVCYTDQKNIKSNTWEIRYIDEVPKKDRAVVVRKYKTLPHLFFPEYDTSIWIDASFQIKGSLIDIMKKYQKCSNMLLLPHYERFCIYDEAAYCMVINRGNKTEILSQIKKYLEEKYPENNGLLAGGFIVRNHMESNVRKLMKLWYSEIENNSKRDQISLPYVIWKQSFIYDLINIRYNNNAWFINKRHKI